MGKTIRKFNTNKKSRRNDDRDNLQQFLSGKPAPSRNRDRKNSWAEDDDYFDEEESR